MPDPYPITGQCVHKFVMAAGQPETLYQQNHCGVYRSDDGGEHWTELTDNGLPSEFAFPMVAHPRDPDTVWVIPLNGADQGRFVPDGKPAVWRTHDRGASWIRADDGLPPRDAYLTVLREAMARDTLDPVGVTFGTETGQLWHSADEGRSWRMITDAPARDLGGRGRRPRRLTRAMATVLLPRSLLALFPGVERRHEVAGTTVGESPGRARRGRPGDARPAGRGGAATAAAHQRVRGRRAGRPQRRRSRSTATVHVIPAVSGGA